MKSCCCEICDIKEKGTSICPECGNTGKPVMEITLRSMVKEPVFASIENPDGFYFCETPTCEVVYFNNEQQACLHKQDVKVRVGIKEKENPVQVCYCFGWTKERIFEQIRQLGYSTAVREITAKIKADECTCDKKNPSGRCCLGEVNKAIKSGQEIYGIKKNQSL
ncbi:MAG: hypothetical protein FIB07_02085 [Candidatus Methanoperedens sp.]|nr:hypothetical protein [Candidatus Methanoperedens sp.]